MSKSIREITKSPTKRPAETGAPVLVRVQPDMLAALDAAIADDAKSNPPASTRPGFVRAILQDWLQSKGYLPK